MSAKRAFYITPNDLTIFIRRGNVWQEEICFHTSPDSLEAFNTYLAWQSDIVSCLLMDLIEEEYRNETIPHVSGRDRQALLKRKMKHLFRATPYCTAQLQGREKFGRRDSRVLYSALTNPDAVEFWFSSMVKNKVPITGIYSLPLVSHRLIKMLKINNANTLLISQQRRNLLRQTFFSGHDLKASRLSSKTAVNVEEWLQFLLDEVQKTQRYLNHQQLLPHGGVLDICILSQGDQLEYLKAGCVSTELTRYHFIDANDALHRLHLKGDIAANQSEYLFLNLVYGRESNVNYARPVDRRYFYMHQARSVLMAASVSLVLGSIVWSASNMLGADDLKKRSVVAVQQTKQLQKRYEQALKKMPGVPVSPQAMHSAVEISKELRRRKIGPRAMLVALSKGLAVNPQIQLDEILWRSADRPDAKDTSQDGMETAQSQPDNMDDMVDDSPAISDDMGSMTDGILGSTKPLYHIATIKGRLEPSGADYHATFKLVDDFIKTLRQDRAFVAVEALAMPVNVDSNAVLDGESKQGSGITKALFEIKAVMKVGHDSV